MNPFFIYINYKKFFIIGVLISFAFQIGYSQTPMKSILPEPIPDWVKSYPNPILKSNYDLDLVLVHSENQYNHVTGENFTRFFYYINTVKGIDEIQSFHLYYEPDYQSFHLHNLGIYRDGKQIKLENNLHSEFSYYGKQINGEHYADDVRVDLYFENTKVGDLLEIVYSKKGLQPDLGGKLTFTDYVHPKYLRGKNIIRILTFPTDKIFHTSLNFKSSVSSSSSSEKFMVEMIYEAEDKPKEVGGPIWYEKKKVIYFTSNKSWADITNISLQNYQLNTEPSIIVKNKTQELVNGINSKEEKIKKILDYITGDINYLDYDLINPKRPETVIRQNFGDCKSKTLLAIKMLECIDIKSWPVIVNNEGFDDRLINSFNIQPFNHAVLEFIIEGDTVMYDGTDSFQHGDLLESSVDDFRYGLRIIKGNDQLTKYDYTNDSKTMYNTTITPYYDNSSKLKYETEREVQFFGRIANQSIELYKTKGTAGVWKNLINDNIASEWCYRTLDQQENSIEENFENFTYDIDRPYSKLIQKFKKCNQLMENDHGDYKAYPEPLSTWLRDYFFNQTGEGPYFALPSFPESEFNYKIILTDSLTYVPDTFHFENDWLKFTKETWQSDDTIYAHYYAKSLKTFLPTERYRDTYEEIRSISERLDVMFDKSKITKIERKENSNRWIENLVLALLTFLLLAGIWWVFNIFKKGKNKSKYIIKLEQELEDAKNELSDIKKDN